MDFFEPLMGRESGILRRHDGIVKGHDNIVSGHDGLLNTQVGLVAGHEKSVHRKDCERFFAFLRNVRIISVRS